MMKKNLKIFSAFLILLCVLGCTNNDLGYKPSTELGWIQFLENQPNVIYSNQELQEVIKLGVNIQVPNTSSDLNINYDMVSVSGVDPNTVFSNNGTLVVPAGETSYAGPDNSTGIVYDFLPTIDFNVADITSLLTEPMIFDVILKSTSSNSISVGLEGEDFPITQRVAICPSFNSSTGILIGDYVLTVPTGAGPFGTIFTDNQIVTISEGNNGPFSRVFSSDYLPDIAAGYPVVDIEFLLEDGSINILDGIATGVGCGAEIILGGNSSNILPSPCGDNEITLNMYEFLNGSGSCGVSDVPFSILLTKL